jgi:indole-3-glycerol phosphate synthase
VLEQILARCRERLADTKSRIPLSEIKACALAAPSPHRFATALRRRDRISIIAEIKFRSPSVGVLRPFQPVEELVREYEAGGANALSILTEPDFFGGNLSDVAQAKAVTSLPVLRKDFLFDPYQIYESRAAGADAILLIAATLERSALSDLSSLASDLGLDVLLELHNLSDLVNASGLHPAMWGVNHRNLKTLEIDLSVSAQLFPLLPSGAIRIAESGIESSVQLSAMRERGADGVLVGTSLMREPSPGAALRGLVCGSSSAVS